MWILTTASHEVWIQASERKLSEWSNPIVYSRCFQSLCVLFYVTLWNCPEMWWNPHPWRLKVRLDGALSIRSSCRCPCSLQGSWIRWSFEDPFQLKQFYYSMILWFCGNTWCRTAGLGSPIELTSQSHSELCFTLPCLWFRFLAIVHAMKNWIMLGFD